MTEGDDGHSPTIRAGSGSGWRLEPGTRLGRYEVGRFLGAGGMGAVYLAHDTAARRTVALKCLPRGEPELEARFQREVRAAAALQHHNIIRLFDVGESDALLYFTMEFVGGPSLAGALQQTRPLPPRTAMRIARDVARGLAHAHERGVIHRDVKPGNVLVVADAPPKPQPASDTALRVAGEYFDDYHAVLADFGLARGGEATALTMSGDILGTPLYMSPEQAAGLPVDARSDVYSLGAMLYECLSGTPPARGASPMEVLRAVQFDSPIPPRKLVPTLSRDAETIVLKALEKEPGRRYATAVALADDLDRFLRGEAILARPASLLYRLRKAARRRPATAATLGLSAVVVLAAAGYFGGPGWIDLRTEPAGAEIFIDGRARGRTPAVVRVWPAGAVRVEIRRDGYRTEAADVTLRPWERQSRAAWTLVEAFGTVETAIDPPYAKVRLKQLGVDMEVRKGGRVPTGTYQVDVSAEGHRPFTTVLTVPPGKTAELKLKLEHAYGYLSVDAGTEGVTMLVCPADDDPVPRGITPCTIEDMQWAHPIMNVSLPAGPLKLDTGDYVLYFTKRNHFARRTAVKIEAWTGAGEPELEEGDALRRTYPAAKNHVRLRAGLTPMVTRTFAVTPEEAATPHLADVDGDGYLDAVLATDYEVSCFSGREGRRLWKRGSTEMILHSSIGDADRDGLPDVVVGTDGEINVYGGREGRRLRRVAVEGERFYPSMGDVDGDGQAELLASSGSKVFAFSGVDGSPLWETEMDEAVWAAPIAADLEGDGAVECVVTTEDGSAHALRGKTGLVAWSYKTGRALDAAPAVGDVDGDGKLECAVPSMDKRVHLLSHDGRLLQEFDGSDVVRTTPRLEDVDGDGAKECVFVCRTGKVFVYSCRSGRRLWARDIGEVVLVPPAMGDVDGDGLPDVVVAAFDQRLHAFRGRDGDRLWELETADVSFDGPPVLGHIDDDGVLDGLVGSGPGEVVQFTCADARRLWEIRVRDTAASPGAFGDIDGDGVVDGMVSTSGNYTRGVRGFDGRMLWDLYLPAYGLSDVWAGDLDGDGRPEGLVARGPCVTVIDLADAQVRWKIERENRRVVGIAIAGRLGAVTWDDGAMEAFTAADGELAWAPDAAARCGTEPLFWDMNADGAPDVVVGTKTGSIVVHDGKEGKPLKAIEVGGGFVTGCTMADLDRDGVPECLAMGGDRRLRAVSMRDGKTRWTVDVDGNVWDDPVAEDFDGDGKPDVAVGTNRGHVWAIGGVKGDVLWRFKTTGGVWRLGAVGDLDGDGVADVVAGTTGDGAYAISGRNGRTLWEFRTSKSIAGGPAVGDLDGDGVPECVISTNDRAVYALKTAASKAARPLERRRLAEREAWRAVIDSTDAADPLAALWRGRAYLGLGRGHEARAELGNTVKAFPGSIEAHVFLAESTGDAAPLRVALTLDSVRTFEAWEALGSAMDPGPDELREGSLERAVGLLMTDRFAEARAALDAQVKGGDGRPELLWFRGRAALEAGDAKAALADFEALEKLEFESPRLGVLMKRAREEATDF